MSDWIESYLQLMVDVQIEAALNLKRMHTPHKLYRYQRCVEHSIDSLRSDTVWLSSPSSYNDPFDCSFSIDYADVFTEPLREALIKVAQEPGSWITQEQAAEIRSSSDPLSAFVKAVSERKNFITSAQSEELMKSLAKARQYNDHTSSLKLVEQHKNALKVCSFSEVKDSIIMWSHYADYHKGFCLEYDLCKDEMCRRLVVPVVYRQKLFDATRFFKAAIKDRSQFNVLFPILAALHKSPEWSYEREWRIVVPANLIPKEGLLRVPQPQRLFLGARMSEESRAAVSSIARLKGIDIMQMRMATDSFSLRAERLEPAIHATQRSPD